MNGYIEANWREEEVGRKMRTIFRFALCVIALNASVNSLQITAAEWDPIALEQRAIDARRAIRQAEMNLHIEQRLGSGEPIRGAKLRAKVFLDGDKLRFDWLREGKDGQSNLAREGRGVAEKLILTDDEFIYFTDLKVRPNLGVAVEIGTREFLGGHYTDAFDPRIIGMVPANPLVYHALELNSTLTRADRKSAEIDEVLLDGMRCERIVYVRNDGLIVRHWICPAKGFSLIRAEVEDKREERITRHLMESTVKPYGSGGNQIWFPELVKFQKFVNNTMHVETRLHVSNPIFNHGIAPKTFTLSDLGVPPGTSIIHRPPKRLGMIWNGEAVVPAGAASAAELRRKVSRSEMWFYGSMVAAVLGAVLLILYFRRANR